MNRPGVHGGAGRAGELPVGQALGRLALVQQAGDERESAGVAAEGAAADPRHAVGVLEVVVVELGAVEVGDDDVALLVVGERDAQTAFVTTATVDKPEGELFALQDEIARAVATSGGAVLFAGSTAAYFLKVLGADPVTAVAMAMLATERNRFRAVLHTMDQAVLALDAQQRAQWRVVGVGDAADHAVVADDEHVGVCHHGRGGRKCQPVAADHALQHIGCARGTRGNRFVPLVALEVHRQTVRRFVAARAVLLQATHDNPVQVATQQRGEFRRFCAALLRDLCEAVVRCDSVQRLRTTMIFLYFAAAWAKRLAVAADLVADDVGYRELLHLYIHLVADESFSFSSKKDGADD